MALGSTQPLTEMSTRNIYWGKGGRCVRLTTLPPSCAVVTKSGNLNFLEPSGPVEACNGTALPLLNIKSASKTAGLFNQGCTNTGKQKFYTMALKICGFLLWIFMSTFWRVGFSDGS